jgi:dTDP-glucose 4,6-dehydratase/UDP-glucose 4-epimerase
MKILIIGSDGFIGSNSVDYFGRKGYQVWTAGLQQSALPNHTTLSPENTDFTPLFQQEQYDFCINASGSANVGLSFENPAKDFELNVQNVHKLLIAIRQHNPKCGFINFSSAAVYGNPKNLPTSETARVSPVSPYGFHKLQSEYLLTEYHKFFGIHTCSLRIFSAYGKGLRKQLFWDLYQKSLVNDVVELFGTGEETRDFICIDDLLQVIDLVIQKANFEGESINVASGIETKIKDAVQTFFDLLDTHKTFSFSGKVKIGDPNNWQASIEKLKQMGFESQYTIQQGLQKYIEWLKNLQ